MGDYIQIKADGDVAFAKDYAIAQINKSITEAVSISETLETKLKELSASVEKMIQNMPDNKAKEITKDLEILANEAVKDEPRRKWYELSGEGLIEAANAVG